MVEQPVGDLELIGRAARGAPASASWDCSAVIMERRFAADHWTSASMAAETTVEHPDDPVIAAECCVATICIDATGEYPARETDGATDDFITSVCSATWTPEIEERLALNCIVSPKKFIENVDCFFACALDSRVI